MEALISKFRDIVGPEWVFTHEHQLRTYESDGLLQYAVTPGAVVLPETTGEVQAVVRACHRAGVPWVARGAGSGRAGSRSPLTAQHPGPRSRKGTLVYKCPRLPI